MTEAQDGSLGRPDYFRIPTVVSANGQREFGTLIPVYKASIDESDPVPEIEGLHEQMQEITGRAAIAVFEEMQGYEAYPSDAPDDVLKPQKDRNDTIATNVMIDGFNALPYTVHVTAEGRKDISQGAEIPHMNGVHGNGSEQLEDDESIDMKAYVDPLEGTRKSAKKEKGASSVAAIAEDLAEMPEDADYMEKLIAPMIVGLSINDEAHVTVAKVAHGLGVDFSKLRVTILNRPRNQYLIDDLREFEEMGLNLNLIKDGDLLPSIMASDEPDPTGKFNIVIGIGGYPEGIIAAAAAKATGKTFFEGRPWSEDPEVRRKYIKPLNINELVPAKADKIVVDLAHITHDPDYTQQDGITQTQNGHLSYMVSYTSVDINGITHHTRTF